jgi:gas vesicle protein
MSTKSKVLLGILGAAAAGVVIGLLIAPEKGSDTRKKIKQTAGDWADNLSGLWQKGRKAAEDFAEEAKDKVRSAKSTAENKVKENYS